MPLLVAAVLVAGCGGSDEPVADATPTPSAATPARTAELTPSAEPTPEPTPRPPRRALTDADVQAFEQFAQGLGGQAGIAVGPPGAGEPVVAGSLSSGAAWSTIKVPIALRVLSDVGGPSGLSAEQDDLMRRAITASDNAAAAALWEPLGASDEARAAAVAEVLRAAGDDGTQVSAVGRGEFSPYGQTEWSLDAQQRLMAALAGGCLPDRASGDYVLDLMGQIAADQTWGLGTTGPTARYKGGWGPGVDGLYLVRQMGVIEVDGGAAVAAIAAVPDDGSFASGTRMLSEIAIWLTQNVTPVKSPGC